MSHQPDWLRTFADAVAAHLHAVELLPPIGCHVHHHPEGWEVTLFASATEVVGGRRDGKVRTARFHVDVLAICQLFDEVSGIAWQTHRLGPSDELGAHLVVDGQVHGEPVSLRIPAVAPKMFAPGRIAHALTEQWEEVW